MIELRQSTAGQEVPLGQFLDSSDGNTEEPSLTIANTNIKIWKWGATTLANKNSGGATYISNGVYYAVFDATDSDTLGAMVLFIHVTGALAVRVECSVITAKKWDEKYGTDYQSNVALKTLVKVVDAADTQFTLDAGSSEDDAYNNMVVSIIDKSTGDIRSRRITNYVGSTKQITVDADFEFAIEDGAGIEDTVIIWADTYSSSVTSIAASQIADAVWDEAQGDHVANGSMGQRQQHSGRGRY